MVAEGDGEVAVVERRAGGVEAGCKAARRRRGRKVDNATTGTACKAVVERWRKRSQREPRLAVASDGFSRGSTWGPEVGSWRR